MVLSGLHLTPYSYSLQQTVSAMVWTLLLMHSTLPCGIAWTPPYPCATPYNYCLQRTVSTMEWTLLLMHATLPCAIELNLITSHCKSSQKRCTTSGATSPSTYGVIRSFTASRRVNGAPLIILIDPGSRCIGQG